MGWAGGNLLAPSIIAQQVAQRVTESHMSTLTFVIPWPTALRIATSESPHSNC
jgi:hypothetical protein